MSIHEARKFSLLIVDDDAGYVEVARTIARAAGIQEQDITAVGTIKEAEQELWKRLHNPPSLVLDDVLPDGRGSELARKLRRTAPFNRIPVIMATADPEEANQQITEEDGVRKYITKPGSGQDLRQALLELIEEVSHER